MTSEQLHSIGNALFGNSWQTDLARELNVSDRTIRNWISGSPISQHRVDQIIEMMEGRAEILLLMATGLRRGLDTSHPAVSDEAPR